ncbi:hypothetical protein OHA59_49680 [Streptomyces sp. NBC_01589]|uniref:hypothetical protein n=1 Tax=Streptomyces sp. NBC_01589 TaxID=2975886 RepID=UPI0038684001
MVMVEGRPSSRGVGPAARKHEDRTLAEERAERARVVAQERRFPLALRIGRMLVEHQGDFVVGTMSEYWLSEITNTIDHRETALKRANFSTFIEGFVREIHQLARERNQPATTTDEARRALMLDSKPRPRPGMRMANCLRAGRPRLTSGGAVTRLGSSPWVRCKEDGGFRRGRRK